MLKIVAVTAGVSSPSSSRILTDMVMSSLENIATMDTVTTVIELKDYAVDIMHTMVNGFTSAQLALEIEKVEQADVIVAVTPVFTASMSGLFKSFFDILDNKMLAGKIVIMGATGGSPRHSMVLDYSMRPMFAYLKAEVMPTSIFAATEDWGGTSGLEERINVSAQEAVTRIMLKNGSNENNGNIGSNDGKTSTLPAKNISKYDHTTVASSLPFEELLKNIAGNVVSTKY